MVVYVFQGPRAVKWILYKKACIGTASTTSPFVEHTKHCLLYTSDAADDWLVV